MTSECELLVFHLAIVPQLLMFVVSEELYLHLIFVTRATGNV